MLIEAKSPSRVDLVHYEGTLVVAIDVRTPYDISNALIDQESSEGAWYITDLPRTSQALVPIGEEGEPGLWRQLFYRLRAEPSARPNTRVTHQFFFRTFVYTDIPRVEPVLFYLIEHRDEKRCIWELVTPELTLFGVDI